MGTGALYFGFQCALLNRTNFHGNFDTARPYTYPSMMDDDVELCTWVDFSLTDIERFLTFCCDREGLKQELRQKLTPRSVENEKQDLIELDMYIYAFLFGVKQEFSSAQLSTLLGIVKRLHAKCISTVFDNQGHVLQFFQQMMVQHSVRRPPFSLCVFSPNEVKKINEYILSTYFKHYKLYKYAFTKKVRLNLGLSYAGQVEPEEAVDEEITSHENEENTVDRESKSSLVMQQCNESCNVRS